MRKENLAGKFALIKGGRLPSGYRGMIKIIASDHLGITAIKPDGRLCELCRHEVRVFRNQTLGWAEWRNAKPTTTDISPGRASS